jgi:hypothetical protein
MRSQQTRVPSRKRTSSAASTCQTSCGRRARSGLAAGRRPFGAGDSPARRNQRCRVRSAGSGCRGCWRHKNTRIKPAPHVGCWRRRRSASSWTSGVAGAGDRPGYEGASASGPWTRRRRSKWRTVRGTRPRAAALAEALWPWADRRWMSWRKGRGVGCGMSTPPKKRVRPEDLRHCSPRPPPVAPAAEARQHQLSAFRGNTDVAFKRQNLVSADSRSNPCVCWSTALGLAPCGSLREGFMNGAIPFGSSPE